MQNEVKRLYGLARLLYLGYNPASGLNGKSMLGDGATFVISRPYVPLVFNNIKDPQKSSITPTID